MTSFIEHDVNEFGKKLFSALEETLDTRTLPVNTLFEIASVSYVQCSKCGFRSEKQDLLSDLNLTVNNPLTRERFSRMELSLLNTLKPDTLDGDNCYFCSRCAEKHPAEKGLEYSSFPKLLLFNCSRFVFDLNTFQRVKVNDAFEFPTELDMGQFVGPFGEVKARLRARRPELFVEKPQPKASARRPKKRRGPRTDKIQEGFQNLHSSRRGKRFRNKKSSRFTKKFLQKERRRFNQMKKSFNSGQDEIFFVKKGANQGDFKVTSKIAEVQIHTSLRSGAPNADSKPKSRETSQLLENEQKQSNDCDSKGRGKALGGHGPSRNPDTPADRSRGGEGFVAEADSAKGGTPIAEIKSGEGFQKVKKIGVSEIKSKNSEDAKPKGGKKEENPEAAPKSLEIDGKSRTKEQKAAAEANASIQAKAPIHLENPERTQEIADAAKKGLPSQPTSPPSTPSHAPRANEQGSPLLAKPGQVPEEVWSSKLKYQLYAIFIHKGTAYAGHYYIYIKSFETNLWYLFDDSQVTEVNLVNVLRDAVGGGLSHANAYMLAYRRADEAPRPCAKPGAEAEPAPPAKALESINETLSLGHLESSLQKTEEKPKGRAFAGPADQADPLDLSPQQLSFKDLAKPSSRSKDVEEALLRKNPRIEGDADSGQLEGLVCPEYLKQIILQEMEAEERRGQLQRKKLQAQAKKLRLRVHFRLEVKTIPVCADESFAAFAEKVFAAYKIADRGQCRLRLFNRIRDEMLDDFAGKEGETLADLKIFSTKNFIIEEKAPGEEFEPYDPLVGRPSIVRLNPQAFSRWFPTAPSPRQSRRSRFWTRRRSRPARGS